MQDYFFATASFEIGEDEHLYVLQDDTDLPLEFKLILSWLDATRPDGPPSEEKLTLAKSYYYFLVMLASFNSARASFLLAQDCGYCALQLSDLERLDFVVPTEQTLFSNLFALASRYDLRAQREGGFRVTFEFPLWD